MAELEHSSSESVTSQSVWFLLNSNCLTSVQVKQVGRALELPTLAVAEEVRQMIDGKL